MDTLHSLFLLLSLVAGALAVALSILMRWPTGQRLLHLTLQGKWSPGHGLAVSILVALSALGVSVVVHLAWGHRPGSPAALPLLEFLRIHPAFIAVASLPLVALALYHLLQTRTQRR
jgi:hypothetical protein